MSDRRSWNVLLSHPAVRYPDVKCRRTEFRMWNVGGRNSSSGGLSYAAQGGPQSAQGYPNQLHPDSPRGHVARSPIQTPSGRSTWHSWTSHSDDRISYPDMLSGSLTSAAIRWCVRTPCPDIFCSLHSGFAYGKGLQSFGSSCFWAFHCFTKDSKELSSITDCFGDQKAIKTPKLNTIWLELIARVLNILIGLKGDNYYSKVFKRVYYCYEIALFE